MAFRDKEVRKMGHKHTIIRQKERQDYRQKNKRGESDIEKWYQTDSPKISDRGVDNIIAGLPSADYIVRKHH